MEQGGVLRLWSARLEGITSHVDRRIRDVLAVAAAGTPGLVAFYPGRHGSETEARRVIATIWESPAALEGARQPGALVALEHETCSGVEETLPLALRIVSPTPPDGPAVILRVFRGVAKAGHLQDYLDACRRGTDEDIAAGAGPVSLSLAVTDPDRFVTVSAWTSWETLGIATGGNVHQPIATRHIGHLVSGSVTHYEILPGSLTETSMVTTARS